LDFWIFDNDNTLYESRGAEKAFSALFERYAHTHLGIPPDKLETVTERLKAAHRTPSTFIACMREFSIDTEVAIAATYLSIDLEACGVTRGDPLRQATLARLKGPKIVFTNNPASYARKVLAHRDLLSFFSDILGMHELQYHQKPHRPAFECVARTIPPSARRVFFCDDSLENLEVGKSFGWQTIWYNPQSLAVPPHMPHRVITEFSELPQLAVE